MKMIITDMDGTLLSDDKKISDEDFKTLGKLGKEGIIRVFATGRSKYSLDKVIGEDFPVDYCVFSTGGGVFDWNSGELMIMHNLEKQEVKEAYNFLISLEVDFSMHFSIPKNHYFCYHTTGGKNPDLKTRCEMYPDYCRPMKIADIDNPAAQFIVSSTKHKDFDLYLMIKKELTFLNVSMTTSPLDHYSTWVEIFPKNVSKSKTSAWLARELDIKPGNVMAIGNDYNDSDLLGWAGKAYVVDNAASELKDSYEVVGSNNNSGFSEGVSRWM